MSDLTPEQYEQAKRALAHPIFFAEQFCQIYDSATARWIPFKLWPAQKKVMNRLDLGRRLVILKARQMGLTWLCLSYALYLMVAKPIAKVLVFSKREKDADYLLYKERLRGMHERIPDWFKSTMNAFADNEAMGTLSLANGSTAHAFPVNGGDSYTATFALSDEADIPTSDEQRRLLLAVQPTIEAGKMVLLSKVDKDKPDSPFKLTFRHALEHWQRGEKDGWEPIFLPWTCRPDRDQSWYDAEKATAELNLADAEDYMGENYPATPEEALASRSSDTRFAWKWLQKCFHEAPVLPPLPAPHRSTPALPGLAIYRHPEPGHAYVVSGDPAENNPKSDDSAAVVLDALSWEEVASFRAVQEPAVFAATLDTLGRYYLKASLLVERNNHGHAVLLWLREHSRLTRIWGHDGQAGWLQSAKGKALLMDHAAQAFRDGDCQIHSHTALDQLASIKASTLRAPEGRKDDVAIAFCLALWAASKREQAVLAGATGNAPSVYEFQGAPAHPWMPRRRMPRSSLPGYFSGR